MKEICIACGKECGFIKKAISEKRKEGLLCFDCTKKVEKYANFCGRDGSKYYSDHAVKIIVNKYAELSKYYSKQEDIRWKYKREIINCDSEISKLRQGVQKQEKDNQGMINRAIVDIKSYRNGNGNWNTNDLLDNLFYELEEALRDNDTEKVEGIMVRLEKPMSYKRYEFRDEVDYLLKEIAYDRNLLNDQKMEIYFYEELKEFYELCGCIDMMQYRYSYVPTENEFLDETDHHISIDDEKVIAVFFGIQGIITNFPQIDEDEKYKKRVFGKLRSNVFPEIEDRRKEFAAYCKAWLDDYFPIAVGGMIVGHRIESCERLITNEERGLRDGIVNIKGSKPILDSIKKELKQHQEKLSILENQESNMRRKLEEEHEIIRTLRNLYLGIKVYQKIEEESGTNPKTNPIPSSVPNPMPVTNLSSVSNPATVTIPDSVSTPVPVTIPSSVPNPVPVTVPSDTEKKDVISIIEKPMEDVTTLNCPKCGARNKKTAKFCNFCGAPIVEERFCTECGKKLRAGKTICSACGTRMD